MDTFLRKHDVDVGKAFGVIFLAAVVHRLYATLFDVLWTGRFTVGVEIIVLLYLGRGMYRHDDVARRVTLVFAWVSVALCVLLVIVSPFLPRT